MNTPNNKRKRESQEKIEKTFLQLIQKKNISEISVSTICEIAKLNRSTFYANYVDVYDLVEKVKNRMADEFAEFQISNNSRQNPGSDLVTDVESSPEYKQMLGEYNDLFDTIEDKELQEKLAKLEEMKNKLYIENDKHFAYVFSLAVQLMSEAFSFKIQ